MFQRSEGRGRGQPYLGHCPKFSQFSILMPPLSSSGEKLSRMGVEVGKCGGGWRWVVGSDRYRASSAPLDLALGKNPLMVPFLDQFQGLK